MKSFLSFRNDLVNVCDKPLLGEEAHIMMSPPGRKTLEKSGVDFNKVKIASVAIHLFYNEGDPYFLLMLRSTYPGIHSSQISFPGGKRDDSDPDLEYTARRESEEELGIDSESGELIKVLSPLFIPLSNFLVHPFLILHEITSELKINPSEVQMVYKIKWKDLKDDLKISKTKIEINALQFEVPCFQFEDKIVWGATAMILYELKSYFNSCK